MSSSVFRIGVIAVVSLLAIRCSDERPSQADSGFDAVDTLASTGGDGLALVEVQGARDAAVADAGAAEASVPADASANREAAPSMGDSSAIADGPSEDVAGPAAPDATVGTDSTIVGDARSIERDGAAPDSGKADQTSAQPDSSDGRTARACPSDMVFIPGGSFELMQANLGTVTVRDLCVDITLVTTADYASLVGPLTAPDGSGNSAYCNYQVAGRENDPINCVDVNQAAAYCDLKGKRLPTEAEWEWAARNGTRASTYPWGEQAPTTQLCWSGLLSGGGLRNGTCPVGAFSPAGDSAAGMKDMAGNLWEWTSSLWSTVANDRVHRGGSWRDSRSQEVTVGARRPWATAITRRDDIGFRCVR